MPAVYVRLSHGLATALNVAAASDGISAAGWVRSAIARALPTHVDIQLPPSPRRRPVVIPPEDVAAVARLVGAVGMCTGATVQLAKALRESSHPAHNEAEDVLRGLRSAQAELLALISALRPRVDAGAAT